MGYGGADVSERGRDEGCCRRPKTDQLGMRTKTWTGYAMSPKLLRYSRGLRAPKDILIRFSLYQRM